MSLAESVTTYSAAEQRAIDAALNIVREKWPTQDGDVYSSPCLAARLMQLHIAKEGHDREHFVVAFLDAQHRLLAIETLFSGTIDGAAVYPRVIARRALMLNASAIVLGHNHPSGSTEPSAADRHITERICSGLALLEIRTLDHVIVTPDDWMSFAEQGLI